MRGYKTLLMPAMLALAVHAALAADDDGTFTINIQGPEESVTTQSSNEDFTRSRVEPQNTRQATSSSTPRQNPRRTQSVNALPKATAAKNTNNTPVSQNTATSVPSQGTYVVTSRDTLWSIATRYLPSDRSVNEFQIVASIYRNNPNAFANGNVNRLRAGRINIPALSEIARESAAVGSRLLNQGSLQLPPLAPVSNNETEVAPADTKTPEQKAVAKESAQKVIDNANSLPQYQATENVVAEARLNHKQELEQKARTELERATGALNDKGQKADTADNSADNAKEENTIDATAAKDNEKSADGDTIDISPRRNVADGKLDTQALRMLLEGSQKQIDMRMKEINQKLMDTIERMQKANDAVTKSTDAAVAALAKQYDGMIAELQQNVTELKGEIAALDRDTTSMREMILANDEKIDAMQVTLADGKVGGQSAKSDFSKAYNYMLAGFGFLALMLLMLYVIFRIKIRNRNRNLQTAMSELGETKSQVDDELLSSSVANESADPQPLSQEGWNEAAMEVDQAEGGKDSMSDEDASRVAKAMLKKAVQVESARDKAETEAIVSKVVSEDSAQNNSDNTNKPQSFHPAEHDDESKTNGSDTDATHADMSVKIDDEGTTIIDEMDYEDEEKQQQQQQAQANFESVLNDYVERGAVKDADKQSAVPDSKKAEDLKDIKFSEFEPGSSDDDLSNYIGSAGSEWFNKVNGGDSSINDDDLNFKVSADGDPSHSVKDQTSDNLSLQDVDDLLNTSQNASKEDDEPLSDSPMSQQELADAWEKALAEQSAAQTYEEPQDGSADPKSDASATTGGDADALSDNFLPEEPQQESNLNDETLTEDKSTATAENDPLHDVEQHAQVSDDLAQDEVDDITDTKATADDGDNTEILVEDIDSKKADTNDADDASDDELALKQSMNLAGNDNTLVDDTVDDGTLTDDALADDHKDGEKIAKNAEATADEVIDDEMKDLDAHSSSDSADEAVDLATFIAQSLEGDDSTVVSDEAPRSATETDNLSKDEESAKSDASFKDASADDEVEILDEDIATAEDQSLAAAPVSSSDDEQQQDLKSGSDDLDKLLSSSNEENESEKGIANSSQERVSFFEQPEETAQQAAERLFAHDFFSSMFADEEKAKDVKDESSDGTDESYDSISKDDETTIIADDDNAVDTDASSEADGVDDVPSSHEELQQNADKVDDEVEVLQSQDHTLSDDTKALGERVTAAESFADDAEVVIADNDVKDSVLEAPSANEYTASENPALNDVAHQDDGNSHQETLLSNPSSSATDTEPQADDATEPLQDPLHDKDTVQPEEDKLSEAFEQKMAADERLKVVSQEHFEPQIEKTADDELLNTKSSVDDLKNSSEPEHSLEDYESSLTSDHGMATWGYTDEEEFGVDEDPAYEVKAQDVASYADGVPPEDKWSDLDKNDFKDNSYTPFTWAVPDDEEFDVTLDREGSPSEKTRNKKNIDESEALADDHEPNFYDHSQSSAERLSREQRAHESFSSQDGDDSSSAIVNMLSESVPKQELDDLDLKADLSASDLQNMLAEPDDDLASDSLKTVAQYLAQSKLNDAQAFADKLTDNALKMKALDLIARYKGER